MEIHPIGDRGTVFEFDDPYLTNVYVINSSKHIFVCDTFCGSESMDIVKNHLKNSGDSEKPVIIFNSHSHYDHVWGNGSLNAIMIIAHNDCRRLLEIEGQNALDKFRDHKRGDVVYRPPDVTFRKRIVFAEDGVEFFHTPGHTIDSSSCLDIQDRILFVGDNIETPIPYLNEPDLTTYIATLQSYLDIDWKYVIPGHDPVQSDATLIKENIGYLRDVESWNLDFSSVDKKIAGRHILNIAEISDKLVDGPISTDIMEHYQQAISFLESEERAPPVEQILEKLKRITDQS